jgi:uncharacterized membrane protein YphA (DoxX/SURF4 family)
MKKFLSPMPLWQNSGMGFIRIIVGLLLVYHGWEVFNAEIMKGYTTWDTFKGFSYPSLVVYTGKAIELLAGILLALGLFTRIACILVIVIFLYITFGVGNGKFWYDDQHPFMFVITALMFFFTGPGNFCLDALRGKKGPTVGSYKGFYN